MSALESLVSGLNTFFTAGTYHHQVPQDEETGESGRSAFEQPVAMNACTFFTAGTYTTKCLKMRRQVGQAGVHLSSQ